MGRPCLCRRAGAGLVLGIHARWLGASLGRAASSLERRGPLRPGTIQHALGQAWLLGPVPVSGLVVTYPFAGVALQAGGMRPAGRWTSVRSASTWTHCRSATFSVPSQSLLPQVCLHQCRYVAHSVPPPSSPCSACPRSSLSPSLGGAGEGCMLPLHPTALPSLSPKHFSWLLHLLCVPAGGLVVSKMYLHQQAHAAGLRDVQHGPS